MGIFSFRGYGGSVSLASLKEMEVVQRRLIPVHRILLWILLLLLAVAAVDLVRWSVPRSVAPLLPNLGRIEEPLASFVPVNFQPASFQPARPSESGVRGVASSAEGGIPPVPWKVRGISLGATKRAFLEDTAGQQSVWVTEGEAIGGARVSRIEERSVILETGGDTYEIWM
jgi:hypothetical protein